MRKDEFEFSIFWSPCEKTPWENPTVQPPVEETNIWGHPRPRRPPCRPMKRRVGLWGYTTVASTVTVCEISPRRQITMDLMFWRMIIKQWLNSRKYTQNITLSLGKWVRDVWAWGTAFRKSILTISNAMLYFHEFLIARGFPRMAILLMVLLNFLGTLLSRFSVFLGSKLSVSVEFWLDSEVDLCFIFVWFLMRAFSLSF